MKFGDGNVYFHPASRLNGCSLTAFWTIL